MVIVYEMIKIVFFMLSILIGLFYARWSAIFSNEQLLTIGARMLPGYLIFCGLMIAYLWVQIMMPANASPDEQTKMLSKWFVGGVAWWIVLALIYMFVLS